MALTVTEIRTIITTLESHMANPAGQERFGDNWVTWRSTQELNSQILYYKSLLSSTEGGTVATRFIRVHTRSGY